MQDNVNLSSLFSATFDTIQSNLQLIAVFLAIMIPVGTLSAYFEGEGGASGFDFGFMLSKGLISPLAVVVVLATFIVGVVATYWLLAGMVRGSISPGFDRILPYIGIYILSIIAIFFGILLLIVPGIILAVRWTPLLAIVVGREEPAMNSFGTSWEMTAGRGWSIFGAVLVLGVLYLIAATVVGGATTFLTIGGGFGGTSLVITSVHGSIIAQLSTVLFTAFAVGAYHLMRENSETLTEVFE